MMSAAWLALAACSSAAEPEASAASSAAAPAAPAKLDPSAPAAKRLLGRYRMRLSQVPNAQLAKELVELKRQGKADDAARIEYTFTDTEVILDTYGAAGRNRARFYYEILSESGDDLVLRKHGDRKGPEEVRATVKAGEIFIRAENEERIRLERIE